MALQSFHARKKGSRLLQPPARQRPKVILSKEARATLTLQRQEKSQRFRADLENAWSDLNNKTVKIASDHHKSVRHVQHELYYSGPLRRKHTKSSAWNAFFWKVSQNGQLPSKYLANFCTQ